VFNKVQKNTYLLFFGTWIMQDPSKRGSSAKKRRRQQLELESEDSDAPPELLIDEQGTGSPFSQQSISPFVYFLVRIWIDNIFWTKGTRNSN
jgi:hypothetical protein